ncbi:hypothetical protein N9B94_03650, partial [Verrucomicrobia bacterium]|nr:hypothetical protein [Verrucomicrobiota bacterium]
HTVSFDWKNGPPPAPRNFEDVQRHNELLRKKRLGITSYSGVYSFLYMEPYEMRMEILIPMMSFETWLTIPRKDQEEITIEEQTASAQLLQTYFSTNAIASINGTKVTPELTRVDYYGLDFKDFAQRPTPTDLSLYQARMGIILTYPSADLISDASLKWSGFTKRIPYIKADVMIGDEASEKFYFEPTDPTYNWTNSGQLASPEFSRISPPPAQPILRLPVLGMFFLTATFITVMRTIAKGKTNRSRKQKLALVAVFGLLSLLTWSSGTIRINDPFRIPVMPDQDLQTEITRSLLNNLYSAFAYKKESAVYDALERSLSPGILRNLYLQIQTSLKSAEQGGARSRISDVDWLEITPTSTHPKERVFRMNGTWTVRGSIEHWGHVHERQNLYNAKLRIGVHGDSWRVQSLQITQQRRQPLETKLRD